MAHSPNADDEKQAEAYRILERDAAGEKPKSHQTNGPMSKIGGSGGGSSSTSPGMRMYDQFGEISPERFLLSQILSELKAIRETLKENKP